MITLLRRLSSIYQGMEGYSALAVLSLLASFRSNLWNDWHPQREISGSIHYWLCKLLWKSAEVYKIQRKRWNWERRNRRPPLDPTPNLFETRHFLYHASSSSLLYRCVLEWLLRVLQYLRLSWINRLSSPSLLYLCICHFWAVHFPFVGSKRCKIFHYGRLCALESETAFSGWEPHIMKLKGKW